MNQALQLSEQALRLALAVAALALAAWTASPMSFTGLGPAAAAPRPGAVLEW